MECAKCAIVCVPGALSAEERRRSALLREHLAETRLSTTETSDGYVFAQRPDPAVFLNAAEWVSLERRCCPFFSFELRWAAGEGTIQLRVSGPEGVKDFLRQELPVLAAFSSP